MANGSPTTPELQLAPLEDLPPMEALDPQVVTLWRLQRVFRLSLLGIPFAVAVGLGVTSMAGATLGAVAGLSLVFFQLVMLVVWPSLEYRAFRYSVREHDLLVQSGVLFRHWSSIPHGRIQHVDTRQGPMERLLGLARLQVYTAAGMSADGSIPGLDADIAEELRDQLSRRGGDDGV